MRTQRPLAPGTHLLLLSHKLLSNQCLPVSFHLLFSCPLNAFPPASRRPFYPITFASIRASIFYLLRRRRTYINSPCTVHHLLNRWYLSPVSGVCAKYGSEKTHSSAILDAVDTEISAHQLWCILFFYSWKLNFRLCICCNSWSSFVADEIGALKLLILVRWTLLISRCQALFVEILSSARNCIPEMVFFMFMCSHFRQQRALWGFKLRSGRDEALQTMWAASHREMMFIF